MKPGITRLRFTRTMDQLWERIRYFHGSLRAGNVCLPLLVVFSHLLAPALRMQMLAAFP